MSQARVTYFFANVEELGIVVIVAVSFSMEKVDISYRMMNIRRKDIFLGHRRTCITSGRKSITLFRGILPNRKMN